MPIKNSINSNTLSPRFKVNNLPSNHFRPNPSTTPIKHFIPRILKNLLGICFFNKYWNRITLQIPINQVMVINRKINRRKPPEEENSWNFFSCLGLNRTSDQIERRPKKKGKEKFLKWSAKARGWKIYCKAIQAKQIDRLIVSL